MRTREEIERIEAENLAPYAMKSQDSLGREYDNTPHPIRTCYQRDRDRIVHSEAFRKLEYKTQVFVILEGDYYRTRLTHSIEVAQIARTIGRNLCLNEDLIEAVALAHDLGHPPFGHAGETALNKKMQQAGGAFDHNLRSYEIVTKFEKRYPDFIGLDLSREVLVGILKHETVYDQCGDVAKYRDDGPTLEAKVVDIADALAYLSHDIDDGLTSGLLTKEDLQESDLFTDTYDQVDEALAKENKGMLKYQLVKFLIDKQMKDLLAYSSERLSQLNFQSSNDVKNYHLDSKNEPVIDFSPEMKRKRNSLQDILKEKLYFHYRVLRMTEKAQRILNEIFDVYVREPNQLPYNIWPRETAGSKTEKEKYEAICNYIASMTDRYALDEYKKLFDPFKKV